MSKTFTCMSVCCGRAHKSLGGHYKANPGCKLRSLYAKADGAHDTITRETAAGPEVWTQIAANAEAEIAAFAAKHDLPFETRDQRLANRAADAYAKARRAAK